MSDVSRYTALRGTVYVLDRDDRIIRRTVCEVDPCDNEDEFRQEAALNLLNAEEPNGYRLEYGPIAAPWRKV